MNPSGKLIVCFAIMAAALLAAGCSTSTAEKALQEATGFQWELDESSFVNETGVSTPYDWKFLFGVNLSSDQASVLNGSFSVDLSLLEKVGFTLPTIDHQIIAAHATAAPNKKAGLRYANKILFQDKKVVMDGDSITKLGSSVGASGAGWYGVYYTMEAVGFLKGTVKDCNGNVPQGNSLLVNATDGPFWTFASSTDGSWALPSINDKSAAVAFDAGNCASGVAGPVTDTNNNPDGKDPTTTLPTNTPLNDNTNVIDVGVFNLQNSTSPGTPATGAIFYFDNADDWDFIGTAGECFDIESTAYDVLFPEGKNTNKHYGLLSTGWSDIAKKTSCTVSRTFTVPAGVSHMVVSYDFLSQEYPHWVNSPYNDIFTVIIQGETEYVVHRTIIQTTQEQNWLDLPDADAQLGWIASSDDAKYNQWGNGAHKWDGHLKYTTGSDSTTPRGANDTNQLYGRVASYAVTPGATITVLFTVSDVADAIYDSAAALDYVAFE